MKKYDLPENVEKELNGLTKFLLAQGVPKQVHNTLYKDFLILGGMSKRGVRASSFSLRIQLVQNRFHEFAGFVQSWRTKNLKEKVNQ